MNKDNWKDNLLAKYDHLLINDKRWAIRMFGLEVRDGWRKIIEVMLDKIDEHVKQSGCEPVQIQQIKEKFGTLRVYYEGGDTAIGNIVHKAEHLSAGTCELCGSRNDVGITMGWITTCCRKCWQSHDRLAKRGWRKNGTVSVLGPGLIKLPYKTVVTKTITTDENGTRSKWQIGWFKRFSLWLSGLVHKKRSI